MNWKIFLPTSVLIGLGIYFLVHKRHGLIHITPAERRAIIVQKAMAEEGSNDTKKYWDQAAPGTTIAKGTSWCGAFALWVLKQAGLALNWFWSFGKGGNYGFLYKLPITHTPQPGDIAYVAQPYQHHAVVHTVNPDGTVNLINGNGTGGKVSLSTTPKSHITAFYSVEPLVAA